MKNLAKTARRVVEVRFDVFAWLNLGSGTFQVAESPLPRDARLVCVGSDDWMSVEAPRGGYWWALLEHESFAEVAAHAEIPVWPGPMIKRVDLPADQPMRNVGYSALVPLKPKDPPEIEWFKSSTFPTPDTPDGADRVRLSYKRQQPTESPEANPLTYAHLEKLDAAMRFRDPQVSGIPPIWPNGLPFPGEVLPEVTQSSQPPQDASQEAESTSVSPEPSETQQRQPCAACEGIGYWRGETCRACHGVGVVVVDPNPIDCEVTENEAGRVDTNKIELIAGELYTKHRAFVLAYALVQADAVDLQEDGTLVVILNEDRWHDAQDRYGIAGPVSELKNEANARLLCAVASGVLGCEVRCVSPVVCPSKEWRP